MPAGYAVINMVKRKILEKRLKYSAPAIRFNQSELKQIKSSFVADAEKKGHM